MHKTKWVRLVESFILPILTITSGAPVGISQAAFSVIDVPPPALLQKLNTDSSASIAQVLGAVDKTDSNADLLKEKAQAIDEYFKAHDMPLYGTGQKMVEEAEKNGLDWRLLPAIAVRESTGGKYDCKRVENNPFGWNSCKVGFGSNEEAIEVVAKNLGGKNPNTARHYENKTVKEILRAYNPPSVIPHYAEQVMSIMNSIGSLNDTPTVAVANG